jgi:hypothetical protein
MVTFDIGEIRMHTKMLAPLADFDGAYTFYYDETDNISAVGCGEERTASFEKRE